MILFDGAQFTTIEHDYEDTANIIIMESTSPMQVGDNIHVEESESENQVESSTEKDDSTINIHKIIKKRQINDTDENDFEVSKTELYNFLETIGYTKFYKTLSGIKN